MKKDGKKYTSKEGKEMTSKDKEVKIDSKDDKDYSNRVAKQIIIMRKHPKKNRKGKKHKK